MSRRICSKPRPPILTAHDGRIAVAGTDRSVSFREVARAVYSQMGRLPAEARGELAATKTYDPVFGTTTCATHIATLEIDPLTYEVRLGRYVVAEDCGKIINPQIVDGQVHGGVAQGIGAALYEEVVYDNEGQLHTASLVDYLVPAASEIPSMQVVHLDTASPTTLGRLSRHGRGWHHRRAGRDRERARRCAVAARDRDRRTAGDAGTAVPADHGGKRKVGEAAWIWHSTARSRWSRARRATSGARSR